MTTVNSSVGQVEVDGFCNEGEWFGETWLIGLGSGLLYTFLVAEAGDEQNALDSYADSKHAHFTRLSSDELTEPGFDFSQVDYIGNFGDPHDLTELRILERVKIEN
jgi:hypothetical protein